MPARPRTGSIPRRELAAASKRRQGWRPQASGGGGDGHALAAGGSGSCRQATPWGLLTKFVMLMQDAESGMLGRLNKAGGGAPRRRSGAATITNVARERHRRPSQKQKNNIRRKGVSSNLSASTAGQTNLRGRSTGQGPGAEARRGDQGHALAA